MKRNFHFSSNELHSDYSSEISTEKIVTQKIDNDTVVSKVFSDEKTIESKPPKVSPPKTKTIVEILEERSKDKKSDPFSFYSRQEFDLANKFIINVPLYCGQKFGQNVDLVFVVMSAVEKFEQRTAIRQTWGRVVLERGFRLLFFVGKSLDPETNEDVLKESEAHEDVIQAAFVDNYYNNTLKAISTLNSLKQNCEKVRFVVKTDDDMLLNIQIAIDFAKHNQYSKKSLYGLIYRNAPVNRSKTSKWFVPQYVFPYLRYPSYATGAVYMFTGDSIAALLSESVKQNAFYVDDVFITGIVAQKVGVRRIQANNFVKLHYADKLDAWTFATFLGTHGYSATLLTQQWSKIHRHVSCL